MAQCIKIEIKDEEEWLKLLRFHKEAIKRYVSSKNPIALVIIDAELRKGTGFSAEDKNKAWIRTGGVCELCENLIPLRMMAEFDHRVPKMYGGSDNPWNLGVLHGLCHKIKTGLERIDDMKEFMNRITGGRIALYLSM